MSMHGISMEILPPNSDSLLKTQAVYSYETQFPTPHVIPTYTILFLHHFENLK
jgi:hypothetical protein